MLFRLFSYITVGECMKIETINLKQFLIFINSSYCKDINFFNKDSLIQGVKKILLKLKDKIFLRGFYKVKVYVNAKLGLFLEVNQLEEFEYENSLDFRVIVYLDEKIYFRTEDYFLLPANTNVYYDKKYYYCDVDEVSDIQSILEFGDFVYGKNLYQVMNNWNFL